MSQSGPPVRRQRHLHDPDHPRPRPREGDGMSLDAVQKWVMSALAVSTIFHLGIVAAWVAVITPADRVDARIGLNVVAAFFGVTAVVAGLLIHQRHPLTPWLLLGLLPGVVGALLTFG